MKLILYFTLGYPSTEVLQNFLSLIPEDTVEYIELGFPSADPKYDGPAIRKTHGVAISQYDSKSLPEIVELCLRKVSKVYALRYYSDFESDGSFIPSLKDAGFSGIIAPDLMTDYFHSRTAIVNSIQGRGLEFIPFINPSTPDSVAGEACGNARSWIYYGLLPSTGIGVPYDLRSIIERISLLAPSKRVVLGFGIRSSGDLHGISGAGVYGIAVGTVLIDFLERNDASGFVSKIEELAGVIRGVGT